MVDLENGLVLHLPMNDGKNSTKVMDKSKYQNHGTINGAIAVRPYLDMSNTSEEEGEAPLVIYDDDETFWTAYGEGAGSYDAVISEETTIVKKGASSLKMVIGAGASVHVGVTHAYGIDQDWSKYDFLTLWVYGANTGLTVRTVLYAPDAANLLYIDFTDNFSGWQRKILPFQSFAVGAGSPNLSTVRDINMVYLFVNQNFTSYLDRTTIDIGNWRFGDAMVFDGLNDEVTTSDDAIFDVGGALTVECWFQTVKNQTGTLVVHDKSDYKYLLYLFDNSRYIRFYIVTASGTDYALYDSGIVGGLTDGKPHHVVGTFDKTLSSNRIKIYVDGKASQYSSNGYAEDIVAGDEGITIASVAGTYAKVNVSEVRIYNRALSPEEIMLLYKEKEIDLQRGLVLDLSMNEGDGSKVYDRSKHQNHGTITGATWVGNELDFDGSGDYVTIVDADGLNPVNEFSIACKVNLDSYTAGQTTLISKFYTQYEIFIVGAPVPEGYLRFYLGNGTSYGTYITDRILALNTDYHIVVTVSSNRVKIYVDGKLWSSTAISVQQSYTTNDLAIGRRSGGAFNLDGIIKDVKMWNRVLSAEEIIALYLKGV